MSVEKEIGLILRQARESIGLSLEDLQEKTNVQRSFLTAIEDGDFNKLPSPFYVRTYLRNYANSVKIEPHHILRHYRKAEQAERGLTGVHKVVSQQTTLTEQLRLNTSKNTGGHSSSTSGNTMKNKKTQRVARTSTHTALTIAKKSSMAKSPSHSQQTNPTLNKRESRTELTHTNPTVLPQTGKLEDSGQQVKMSSRLDKYSQAKSNTYQSLSRSRIHKEISNTVPPRKTNSVTEVTQSVSQIPSLSRSAALRRGSKMRASSNPLGKRAIQLIIASVVICIPLLWVVFSFFSDDSDHSQTPAPENQIQQNNSVKPVPGANTQTLTHQNQITLKESVGNTNHYEVSGVDKVKINFQATGESWIQVRKQREIQKSGFLDEAILQPGNSDVYEHDFVKGKDIWITLAIPQAVKISVNGQVLKSSKTIHIVKK